MEEYCKYQQQLLEVAFSFPLSHGLAPGSSGSPDQDNHFGSLIRGLNQCISWVGLQRYWCKTYLGLRLFVDQSTSQGKPLEALNMLISALPEIEFMQHHHRKWWQLMKTAVRIAQDLQLGKPLQCEPIQKLLKLSSNAPQPWQGYHIAYCFASLSLWSFQQSKTQKAIEQVGIAIHADPSWGYPEYLLGWYGLILEGIDSVAHFARAVQINWVFFQRIKQDPLCQRFPHILHGLKQRILIKQ